jgi:UDP-GlcNAc:undecaprenyl-phosphate GlcNAc-1-phosphate transferase
VLDNPGNHKSHSSPVPYLGGLAVVVSFSLSMLIPVMAISESSVSREFMIVIGVALALALLGLFDDLRNLSSVLRLACEIAAGVVLWNLDLGVQLVGVSWVDAVITVFWVVGITNAFNLLDNMDGLSAGIAAIASFSFFAIAASNGQYLVAGLSLALGGCALGFLRHNFHPARVYMGDSGALFFGFLVSFVGLKLQFNISSDVSVLVPIVVCSVAVLDTSLVTIARLGHGLSPFRGGRDHISHRLVKVGLPVPVAVTVLYVAAASVGVIAFVIARSDLTAAWVLAGLVAVLLVGLGVLAYNVPVYETSKQRFFSVVEQ